MPRWQNRITTPMYPKTLFHFLKETSAGHKSFKFLVVFTRLEASVTRRSVKKSAKFCQKTPKPPNEINDQKLEFIKTKIAKI
jgi:hypothetical protein